MTKTEPKQERRRAWVWWAGGLAALLMLGAALQPILLPRPSPVTKSAWDRIEKGMTRAQVEKVLGGPEGDYQTRPIGPDYEAQLFVAQLTFGPEGDHFSVNWRDSAEVQPKDSVLFWLGDEGLVAVGFDATGGVNVKEFWKATQKSVGFVDLIRWRLDRLKERWFPPSP